MAEQRRVKPFELKPTQNFLSKITVNFIKKCIDEEREEDLPPHPVVAEVKKELLIVDGHNFISVFDESGRDIDVFVVKDEKDVPESLKGTSRQQMLETKFPYLEQMRAKLKESGFESIADVRTKGELN